MSLIAKFNLSVADSVPFTMTVTATIAEWRAIAASLSTSEKVVGERLTQSGWELRDAINKLVARANEQFRDETTGPTQ